MIEYENQPFYYFTVKELCTFLKEYELPSHPNTVYKSIKVLKKTGLVIILGHSKQWFVPERLRLTYEAIQFLKGFELQCRKISGVRFLGKHLV